MGGQCLCYGLCSPLPKKGGYMDKRTWGKSTLRYDPVKRVCWSVSKKGNIVEYKDLPTYGIEREEMPLKTKQGESNG